MPDSVSTISTSGYAAENRFDDHTIHIDSNEERGPNPTATLLGAYASCFVVGLRIAAEERGYPDLGTVEIDVTGTRDETRNLAAIEFEVDFEAPVAPADRDLIVERALETCHVGNALRRDLEADVSVGAET